MGIQGTEKLGSTPWSDGREQQSWAVHHGLMGIQEQESWAVHIDLMGIEGTAKLGCTPWSDGNTGNSKVGLYTLV